MQSKHPPIELHGKERRRRGWTKDIEHVVLQPPGVMRLSAVMCSKKQPGVACVSLAVGRVHVV